MDIFLLCSIIVLDNNSCDNKTQWILVFLVNSCLLLKDLMDFLDSWIFRVVLDQMSIKYVN